VTDPDLYDVLGVSRDASGAQIRDAYRERARLAHPDRHSGGRTEPSGPNGDRSMADLNEAYRVLRDPGRRALYDATQRDVGSAAPSSTRTAWSRATDGSTTEWFETVSPRPTGQRGAIHPSQIGPARVPWRMLLFCAALGCVGVVALSQFTEPGEPAGPDGILHVGECVVLEPNTDAREVVCRNSGADPDLVVRAFIPFGATCPGLTEPHRDRQGMGIACIDLME
jgi:molecular chaperone DnaJ